MPSDPIDIAALIGSRICHDLISPLGAIGNGVELMMMSGAGKGPELALINDSVTNANARIRFFRVAFGSAAPEQRMSRPEIVSILGDLTRGGRLSVDWKPEGDQARREAKLAFLALQCLESAMPYGGKVSIARLGQGWTVSGQAQKLRIEPELWSPLADGQAPEAPSAAQIQFALLPAEAARQNRTLRVAAGATDVLVTY